MLNGWGQKSRHVCRFTHFSPRCLNLRPGFAARQFPTGSPTSQVGNLGGETIAAVAVQSAGREAQLRCLRRTSCEEFTC
jgi:hypothetical protein